MVPILMLVTLRKVQSVKYNKWKEREDVVKTLLDLQTAIPVPKTVNLLGTFGLGSGRFVVLQFRCNESFTFRHVLLNFFSIPVYIRFGQDSKSQPANFLTKPLDFATVM